MRVVTIIFGLLVLLHLAQSYILLTANLEDVHALARQVASSPVVGQLSKLVRRAADVFNKQLNKPLQKKRANDYDGHEARSPTGYRASRETLEEDASAPSETLADNRIERRNQPLEDLINLGHNASYYLKSISKIIEKI